MFVLTDRIVSHVVVIVVHRLPGQGLCSKGNQTCRYIHTGACTGCRAVTRRTGYKVISKRQIRSYKEASLSDASLVMLPVSPDGGRTFLGGLT